MIVPDSITFQTLSDACKLAKPGYWCAQVDLQSACRSVCVHPDTCSMWTFDNEKEPTYWFDSRPPFRSNVGPSHFHRLSQAIQRCMERRGMTGVIACIDDLLLTASSTVEYNNMLIQSWKKVVGPTQRIRFLGVDVDTRTSTLS